MFGLLKRREAKEEFNKISDSFKDLRKEVVSSKEKIARIEGVISMLIKEKSQQVSKNPKKSQETIEIKVANRVRRNKKSLVMAEISKLEGSMSVIEMYEDIVLSKGLCSKATFYRYIASLKSQEVMRLRQK